MEAKSTLMPPHPVRIWTDYPIRAVNAYPRGIVRVAGPVIRPGRSVDLINSGIFPDRPFA
jgi:hypothetical protein